ncbi:hypothetical protein BIW11_07763 [Tropilaelaps mercedesae]|uniref:Uncharacterized protein n=1 Tax=Tropilaelaps mercedesae TaxID=418985 RepID=A0A1V9XSM5_9ACAR|nr:hypothetical protein BIW11_07763 [Tropilaelaps mercedesae]
MLVLTCIVEEVQYNYTLRKARKLQNSCSHIPDLLLQPEGMLQRDKKGRPQRTSAGQESHREAQPHSKDSNKDNNVSDPEELEQFSGYFNKMNISATGSATGAASVPASERNSVSAHTSPAHKNSNNRRGSPDKTGRESSQEGSSTLENYYTQFNSMEDRSHDGEPGQPLRRVPSQSHIQNFSGSQAALQMMDPDAPDPFQGARDNKQTSFAQLSTQDSSSQVNLTYKAERRSKKPTTTWMSQTPTGDESGDVEEMFAVRQQMDERRQRIEQERRAAQNAAKKERTQTNKQVFQQVVGRDSRGPQGVANGNSSSTIPAGGRGDEIVGGGTSTSEESDRRSPTPPPTDQQKRRRNSAERLAKQEQALNSLIHSRSASHVNHLSGTGQPNTFYLHDAGSPVHGYPSTVMRRQWGPPAAPPAAMYGFGPMSSMTGAYPAEIVAPYWAAPQPSWGASQPPQSLNHTMLHQQQQQQQQHHQAHSFVQQPYNLHEPSAQQQQQMHIQQMQHQQHEQHRMDQMEQQMAQRQQQQHPQQAHLHQVQLQQPQHHTPDVSCQDRARTPSSSPPARPERKKRDTGAPGTGGRVSDERVEQQENMPPVGEKTQEREKDAGSFFISFGDESGGDRKGTVTKPKPKLRPRIQPSRDEVGETRYRYTPV